MKALLKAGATTVLFALLSSVGIRAANAQSSGYPQQPLPSNTNPAINQPIYPDVPQPTSGMAGEAPYDRNMRLGYAALKTEDYPTALNYFRNALSVRPYDRLATISYWNALDEIQQQEQGTARPTNTGAASDYDRFMRIGYGVTNQGDYNTALINFQRALAERPGDPYASQAIRNVSTYLWAEKQAQ